MHGQICSDLIYYVYVVKLLSNVWENGNYMLIWKPSLPKYNHIIFIITSFVQMTGLNATKWIKGTHLVIPFIINYSYILRDQNHKSLGKHNS